MSARHVAVALAVTSLVLTIAAPVMAADLIFNFQPGKHHEKLRMWDAKPWIEPLSYCAAVNGVAVVRLRSTGPADNPLIMARMREGAAFMGLARARAISDGAANADAAMQIVTPKMQDWKKVIESVVADQGKGREDFALANLKVQCDATRQAYAAVVP